MGAAAQYYMHVSTVPTTLFLFGCFAQPQAQAREITERPRAPSGVAAFMPGHSKTPYITPSMDFPSGKGVVRGRKGQQLRFALTGTRTSGKGGRLYYDRSDPPVILPALDSATIPCCYTLLSTD